MGRCGALGRMKHCMCLCARVSLCVRASLYSATNISNVINQNSSLVFTTMSEEIIGHKVKVKVKFTLEEATKELDGGGRSTSRPGRFTPGKDPVPIL